ncbi:MAG: hypothetical protein DRN15_10460 [Thermoprotei archaeon]|nr:MAG: hypothetical protein DRN15_10460 [Thermoprotei archaeon]RLF24334.1 MAG: hypothetical protein DRM97_03575 [Thermoprotei archaeon]
MSSIDWNVIVKRFEEYDKKFYAVLAELREHRKILEEHRKILEEHRRLLEEHAKELLEHRKILERHEEILRGILEEMSSMRKRLNRIELELGALTESTYCRFVSEDLEKEIKALGKHVIRSERDVIINGIEVNLLIETEDEIYVVEVKVRPSIADVGALMAKCDVVRKVTVKKVVPLLAGAMIGKEVFAYANEKGVRVLKY